MAIVTAVSIGTGRKVSANYQSSEANLTVTFELGHGEDADMDAFIAGRAADVKRWHSSIAEQLGGDAPADVKGSTNKAAIKYADAKTSKTDEADAESQVKAEAKSEGPIAQPEAKPEPQPEAPKEPEKENGKARSAAREAFQQHAKRMAATTNDMKEKRLLSDCESVNGVRALVAKYVPSLAETPFSEFTVKHWQQATTAMRVAVEEFDPFADE